MSVPSKNFRFVSKSLLYRVDVLLVVCTEGPGKWEDGDDLC